MIDRIDDTIVAIASPPGRGPLGIVRLSGPDAITIADSLAHTPTPLADQPAATRVAGDVTVRDNIRLPAHFYVFRRPHSYTRQDIVEIHTVGSPAALELIRNEAIERGAVAARPGEFTARAFLSGAMDLTRAEAVAAVIRAQSDTQLRASRRIMDGDLFRRIAAVRDALADLLALVEADIDFAEEPIDFITPAALTKRLEHIAADLDRLTAGAQPAEQLDVLPRIILLGPPNAGKSSLMNTLSGTRRAICAATSGTTRDLLTAPVRLPAGDALLIDAAGIDDDANDTVKNIADDRANHTAGDTADDRDDIDDIDDDTTGDIADAARALALAEAEHADLVCLTVDAAGNDLDAARALVAGLNLSAVVIAANKSDLLTCADRAAVRARLQTWGFGPVCLVSARTGAGLSDLRAALASRLHLAPTTAGAESIVLGERQRTSVRAAQGAVDRAAALADHARDTIDCADVLAFELRDALDALAAVTGDVTTEHLLDRVFSQFCIGK